MHEGILANQFTMNMGDKPPEIKELFDYIAGII